MKIRVRIFHRAGREHYEAQWTDPITRKKKTRTTGTRIRREAERFAGALQSELEEGRFSGRANITWKEFRIRYDSEVLVSQAKTSQVKVRATLNAIEMLVSPAFLSALDASHISTFQKRLRDKRGLEEQTIRGHLTILKVALNWAASLGMIAETPGIKMPKHSKGMRGRPITTEEFERVRGKVEKIVGKKRKAAWLYLLDGLWWSGLRLGEALALHWSDPKGICVDIDGELPFFRIRAASEKGKRDRLLPMAPEFAEYLAKTPKADRRGLVFNPLPEKKKFIKLSMGWVSKVISAIGEEAGVKVSELSDGTAKYASAHDFRRAFGVRWAARVTANELMEIMRHTSIVTTMKYYVGQDAARTAESMRRGVANNPANILNDPHDSPEKDAPKSCP